MDAAAVESGHRLTDFHRGLTMRARLAALTAALLTTFLLIPATSAEAASSIKIVKIYYDSPGGDGGSNDSLNAEWVKLKNTSSTRKSLTGWRLRDADGHVYHFGTFHLAAGASVRIHTGKGTNGAHNRYWGMDWYVWTNTGDTAKLKNASGVLKDKCHYDGGGSYKVC